jgi:spore photoproduct lyase
VQNCPFDCSYCFLQNYLNDGIIKAVGDIDLVMEEVRESINSEPWRLFRIGTWELGDSLAFEKETGQAARLIEEFSTIPNAVLELKTKSDCVDSLLTLNHKHRTVVSWSLNTDTVISQEEHKTAPLEARLDAIHKVARAGYLVGLHFDPMVVHKGWDRGYERLVHLVFETVRPEQVAWISIGSLRFNPEMKKKIENNYPGSRLTCAEMIVGDDDKVRYVKPLRVQMYHNIYKAIKIKVKPENLIYLCMERWDVWDKVLGYHPDSFAHLDYLFAKSMFERFRLMDEPPERMWYKD